MGKRLSWLLISVLLPVMILALLKPRLVGGLSSALSQSVIINEWSQGAGGYKEWVELLVVAGPVDLRGWDLGDNSPGDLVFSDVSLWQDIPAGTTLVIYNQSDPDNVLPADDLDTSDCRLILPDGDPVYFSGALPGFSNTTADDNPHLRDSTGSTVHDFSGAPGISVHPGAEQAAAFQSDGVAGIANASNWSVSAASSASPGQGNSPANTAWIQQLCAVNHQQPDLSLEKSGPTSVAADQPLVYQIRLTNQGAMTATDVILTDTLPATLTYLNDSSGFIPTLSGGYVIQWQLGEVPPGDELSFALTTTINPTTTGIIINLVEAGSSQSEIITINNRSVATTSVGSLMPAGVLIDAFLYDGYEANHLDEAVRLRNGSDSVVEIGGWRINDGEPSTASIPEGVNLAPGQMIWIAKNGEAFRRQFGFAPDLELIDSPGMDLPILGGSWPQLSDEGDQLLLMDSSGQIADCVVYEDADPSLCESGWLGEAVAPYSAGGLFAEDGQLFVRRRDEQSGLPVADTNSASDWIQSQNRVSYPGWDLSPFFFTYRITETANLKIGISPDNGFGMLLEALNSAASSIAIESLTLENWSLGQALAAAARRGVSVTVLLEGGPPGGITDQERAICQELYEAGGSCWFMVNLPERLIFDRYRYLHAKFILIDGSKVLISSENLSPDSFPDDDKSDGSWGHRGLTMMVDAAGAAAHLDAVWRHDWDPGNHQDLMPWQPGDALYGLPSAGFSPITVTGGISYAVRYPSPFVISGTIPFEISQSPENSWRAHSGLLGLLEQAGSGDTLMVQQLVEHPYWSGASSNQPGSPNPRLAAYLDAARRGASVRLLLDSYYDDPNSASSNAATCQLVNSTARQEKLRIRCELGNPTGMGIHNKLVLARIDGKGYVHLGSMNGTEQSHKGNRELAIQLQSDTAYALLSQLFEGDWPHVAYLPITLNSFRGPADHLLISEVLYDPPGLDDDEFIELVNPTSLAIDLSQYSVGDAMRRDDFEDVRRFPAGSILLPRQTVVVATAAMPFYAEHGFYPDFEILNTSSAVPDMVDDASWGDPAALLQLGNTGDEIILRDAAGNAVDMLAYGESDADGVNTCPAAGIANSSLERYPYWRDSDVCADDFRVWPFPSPGTLP